MSVGKFLGQQALGLAASTNPLAGQIDTRAWTDARPERDDLRRGRQRAVQRAGCDLEQQLRHPGPGHDAVRSGAAAADQLGGERLGAARAVPAGLGHRRLLSPQPSSTFSTPRTRWSIRSPTTSCSHRRAVEPEPPGRRRRDDPRLQPEPGEARHRQQRADVLGQQLAGLQRRRVQRQRASRPRRLHLRRHHDRADARPTTAPTWRTRTRTTCASAIRRRRSSRCYKASVGYTIPWDIQLSGTFQAAARASASGRPTRSTARRPGSRLPAAAR